MNLKCKQCGYENEGERVYCHNCGTKLDRSVLPKEPPSEESAAAVRKRVKRFATPGRYRPLQFVKLVLTAVFWGAVLACTIEVVRKPEGVPPMPDERMVEAPALGVSLEEVLNYPGRTLAISEEQINGYLYNTVRGKQRGALAEYIHYERSFVNVEPGKIWIATQRSVAGHSVYAASAYEVSVQDGHLVARVAGGALGRLPVHPAVMELLQFPFRPLWEALSRERKLMERMAAVQLEKDHVLVVSPPRAPR